MIAVGSPCLPIRIAFMSQPDPVAARLADLLARTALGDRKAFEQLYGAASAKLFAVSLRIVHERALAEEALQDSFVSIWSHSRDYAPTKGAPFAWMATIVRNRSLDLMRRSREVPDVDDALAANLAAESVLGTLRGRARQRFERMMRGDGDIAAIVHHWEAGLVPMVAGLAPVTPPARVWKAIEERIAPRGEKSPAGLGFWRSLGMV